MTNTATLNLQTINQSNDFIANAKKALRADIVNSRKLTLDSITAVAALSYSLFIHNNPDSDFSIYRANSTEISESRLRQQLINSIFNKQQLEELQSSEGRVIYNKVRAGMIVFRDNLNRLHALWHDAADSQDFINKVFEVVESYGSLAKILKANKTSNQASNQSDNQVAESESESDTEDSTDTGSSTGNKSIYNKISTDLTHVLNLVEKSESLDLATIELIGAMYKKIAEAVAAKPSTKEVKADKVA